MKFMETQRFFILAIANWCIFLNHTPSNVVSLLTLRDLGFSGPVDLLVFAPGYSAALAWNAARAAEPMANRGSCGPS